MSREKSPFRWWQNVNCCFTDNKDHFYLGWQQIGYVSFWCYINKHITYDLRKNLRWWKVTKVFFLESSKSDGREISYGEGTSTSCLDLSRRRDGQEADGRYRVTLGGSRKKTPIVMKRLQAPKKMSEWKKKTGSLSVRLY